MTTYYYYTDFSDVYEALDHLENPGFKAVAALEGVLALAFADTQAQVHVQTGSLKGSGKTKSKFASEIWAGEVEYGGAALGMIHNPVDYAFYEWRRRGAHNFFSTVGTFDSAYGEAIIDGHFKEA